MQSPGFVLAVLIIGAVTGIWSAHVAVSSGWQPGSVEIGPWTAFPDAGSRNANPYARALLAQSGDMPLAVGEGLVFTAQTDDESRPLSGDCIYKMAGRTPPTRIWTLTLSDERARTSTDDGAGASLTSVETIRDETGRFTIGIADSPLAGPWLKASPGTRFKLALRLYDTPVAATAASLTREQLPSVSRVSCR